MGLAIPVPAEVFTPARGAALTPGLVVGPIPDPGAVLTLGQAVAPIPAREAELTLAPAAEPIPDPAVVPTPGRGVGLMRVPVDLVTRVPEAPIMTDGTAHLRTASKNEGKVMHLLNESEVQDFWLS